MHALTKPYHSVMYVYFPTLQHCKIRVLSEWAKAQVTLRGGARVLSTGGGFPPKASAFPSPKVFLKKKLKLFQIKIFFDNYFKESLKVTNVQKCDFSQS